MSEITRILAAMAQGDPHAAGELLPLVYDELRQLAAAQMAREQPGQTLQPTALVHEAYLRLVQGKQPDRSGGAQEFANRRHFFATAARAMRHILLDNVRRRQRLKRGGGRVRLDLDQVEVGADDAVAELLALDEALTRFASVDPLGAELVQLRYFGGLSIPEAAEVLGISQRSTERLWTYARAWLRAALGGE